MSSTSTFSMFGGQGKTFTYNPVTGGTDGPKGSDPSGKGLYYSGQSTPIGGQPSGRNAAQEPTEQSIGRIRSLQQASGQGGEWSGYAQAAQQGGQQAAGDTDQSAERIRQAQKARLPRTQDILIKQLPLSSKRAELIGLGYSPDEADAMLADQTRQAQQAYEESQRQKQLQEQRDQAAYEESRRQKQIEEQRAYEESQRQKQIQEQRDQAAYEESRRQKQIEAQRNQAFYEESERQKQLKWKNQQAGIVLGWLADRGRKRAKLIELGYSPDEADAMLGPAT